MTVRNTCDEGNHEWLEDKKANRDWYTCINCGERTLDP